MASILVIDDDSFVREMLLEMITIEGHTGIGAENGKLGIRLLGQNEFDLVISDIVMPEKEGIETIIHIHKLKPELPIIAVSGGARIEPDSYLSIAQQLGARFTLAKPFTKQDMLKTINACLNI